jgi:predicted transcriptional regulator with HTH domain
MLQFSRILRIKILKKEGYSWANKTFSGYNKNSIKGITYNLEDGKVVKTELPKSSIYRVRLVDDISILRVAMPNVKVGSVIDLQFFYGGIPNNWYFQNEIPTLWSELILEEHTDVEFRLSRYGYESFAVSEKGRYVTKNIPAFKAEPNIDSRENYITKFELEFKSIGSGLKYRPITTSWIAIADRLYQSERFGGFLRKPGSFKSLGKQIKKMKISDEEKLKYAFNEIKKIKWNKDVRLFSSLSDQKFLRKRGTGNSADINLSLVSLLKKSGFKAFPVVLSTKDNGRLPFNPTLKKLNYVIAGVVLNGERILIDATDEFCPHYLLPKRCLNNKAVIIDFDSNIYKSINLDNKKKGKKLLYYNLSIKNDNTFKGKISTIFYDYAALDFRKKCQLFNSDEEFQEDFSGNKPGIQILNQTDINIDSIYQPAKCEFEVTISDQIENFDDELIFYPLLYERITENPYKLEKRIYPLDLVVPQTKRVTIAINLPADYEVVELPEPLALSLPDKSAKCIYNISYANNKLMTFFKLDIRKAMKLFKVSVIK